MKKYFSILILSFVVAVSAGAQVINKVEVTADPASFTGKCPATIKFKATIYSQGSGTITYTWLRSDGGHQRNNLSVSLSGKGVDEVVYTWRLGKNFTGWVAMETVSPNKVKSNSAKFQVTCQ